MHEPLLERIEQLERSVRRWRLACFALAIVVVSMMAIGGTFGALLLPMLPARAEMDMLRAEVAQERAQAQAEREQAQVARRQAEEAQRAARAARQQLQVQQNGQ